MSIQGVESHIDVFERDSGICQYCNEDLLWSYASYESAKFDRISTDASGWVTCCDACFKALRHCSLVSLEERRAFVQQHAISGVEKFRAIAERIRPSNRGLGIVPRLFHAKLLRNGDVISLERLLPSFLLHQPGDTSFHAVVDYAPGRTSDVLYVLDGELHSLDWLTFDIFQRGHVNSPYRKTRFSWTVCPADHWITEAGISLTELRVRLDWDDISSDEDRWSPEVLVQEAKAALPDGEEFPVSFLQRRFRLGYVRACRLYSELQEHLE